jgi:hypothetical protein
VLEAARDDPNADGWRARVRPRRRRIARALAALALLSAVSAQAADALLPLASDLGHPSRLARSVAEPRR